VIAFNVRDASPTEIPQIKTDFAVEICVMHGGWVLGAHKTTTTVAYFYFKRNINKYAKLNVKKANLALYPAPKVQSSG
jgi:hypothetical protein